MLLNTPTTAEAAEEVGRRWLEEATFDQRGVTVTYTDPEGAKATVRAGKPTWREALLEALAWSGSAWGLMRLPDGFERRRRR